MECIERHWFDVYWGFCRSRFDVLASSGQIMIFPISVMCRFVGRLFLCMKWGDCLLEYDGRKSYDRRDDILKHPNAAAVSMVWSYIGELVFNMLVLVGAIKMKDCVGYCSLPMSFT